MPMENALSGIAGIDQLRANVNAGGTASITVGSCRAGSGRRREHSARRSRRDTERAAQCCLGDQKQDPTPTRS